MKIFKQSKKPPLSIELSKENLDEWPIWKKLLDDDKVLFDLQNKLRYSHGAPVGKLLLIKIDNNGIPVYKESSDEWFDPNSIKAHEFVWPV